MIALSGTIFSRAMVVFARLRYVLDMGAHVDGSVCLEILEILIQKFEYYPVLR
jgi:hypothetical protein